MIRKLIQVFSSNNTTDNRDIPNLEISEFMSGYHDNVNAILLDVRTDKEISNGKITGANNIDFLSPTFISEMKKLDRSKEYFVYCRSGKRSMKACIAMQSIGIHRTVNLKGGYMAYEASVSRKH